MEKLLIVKIGGNILDSGTELTTFLHDFASLPSYKILVHGGGKIATELSAKLGVTTKIVDGRRITDEETVKIVTMAYAGWINKSVTAKLQSLECNAIGLCGADAKIIPAVKRPVKEIDYGWVGDIEPERINSSFLKELLAQGYTPVIAPVSCNAAGHLLNINADTVARALAMSLSNSYHASLIYCFEKNGLLSDVNNEHSLIGAINLQTAQQLKDEGVISKGMIPKIDNALCAAAAGVQNVVIGHATFIKEMAQQQKGYGTRVKL